MALVAILGSQSVYITPACRMVYCNQKINKFIKLVCVSHVQNTMFQPIAPVSRVWTLALVVLALPPLTAYSVSRVLLKNSMMTDPCKLSYQNEHLHHMNSQVPPITMNYPCLVSLSLFPTLSHFQFVIFSTMQIQRVVNLTMRFNDLQHRC